MTRLGVNGFLALTASWSSSFHLAIPYVPALAAAFRRPH